MNNNKIESPAAKTAMLVRKPVQEVFDAFINPEITTKFWFTKSTGKLEADKKIEWTWEMYNITVPVVVKEIAPNQKIVIEWGNYQNMSTVEWRFTTIPGEGTYVEIINSGFQDNNTQPVIEQALDSTKGFSFVLSGLKAFLEHKIQLNLVKDAFPKIK